MSSAPPAPGLLTTAGPATLRLVLFGMPDAGKSSLLGALAQAAETQGNVLNGRLADVTHGLAELRQRLYEEQPRQTVEEIIPYPVVYEPFPGLGAKEAPRLEAVLVDCDGRIANEYLSRQRSLHGVSENGTLGHSVLEADTLILAVDASSSPTQLNADFAQFGRFLRLLQYSRGRRTDISGLPVFLVLTKCDLLVAPGDAPVAWLEVIEARKRQVAHQFEDFLAQNAIRPESAFGRIDLHVWATAVKRPELAGSPGKPREPFGVAELFRQCLETARVFRDRRQRSSRRLAWTVAGSIGALTVLLIALAALLLTRRSSPTALENAVDRYRSQELALPPAARLRTPTNRIVELSRFRGDPAFGQLPDAKQVYVMERLRELHAFQDYEATLEKIPSPHSAATFEQLSHIEASLTALRVPDEYRVEWGMTDAGRQQQEWLEDIAAIRATAREVIAWCDRQTERGVAVLAEADKPELPARAAKVLKEASSPPFPQKDLDRLVPGSRRVSFGTVLGIREVEEARARWQAMKDKLEPAAKLMK